MEVLTDDGLWLDLSTLTHDDDEECAGCPLCEPDKNLHCPKCCSLGFPF